MSRASRSPDPEQQLSDRDYQTLARFRHALRVFQRFSEDAARAVELTPSHHQLMLAVRGWSGDGDPTVSDLAEQLQIKNHSTVELIKRAAAAGLVSTRADPADQRRQLVEVTPHGERLLSSLSLQHRDELRRFRSEMHDVLKELG